MVGIIAMMFVLWDSVWRHLLSVNYEQTLRSSSVPIQRLDMKGSIIDLSQVAVQLNYSALKRSKAGASCNQLADATMTIVWPILDPSTSLVNTPQNRSEAVTESTVDDQNSVGDEPRVVYLS